MSTTTLIAPQEAAQDRANWEAALAAYREAEAAEKAYEAEYIAIHERFEAGRPDPRTVNLTGITLGGLTRDQFIYSADLDDYWTTYVAAEGKAWHSRDPEARKAQLRATLDAVAAFREAIAANTRSSGIDEAEWRFDRLVDTTAEARKVLLQTPAPDLAALRFKLDYLLQIDALGDTSASNAALVAQTHADMARLLPAAS